MVKMDTFINRCEVSLLKKVTPQIYKDNKKGLNRDQIKVCRPPPRCFVPSDLSKLQRKSIRLSQSKKAKYVKKLNRFILKLKEYKLTEKAHRSDSEATSEFNFFSVSCKPPVPSERVTSPYTVPAPQSFRVTGGGIYRQSRQARRSSRSVLPILDLLKCVLITVWILFTLFIILYTSVRCYQQVDGLSFLVKSAEGHCVVAFMFVSLITAIIMFCLFIKYNEIRRDAFCNDSVEAGFELRTFV